ncbi:FkbM family methyltransferase [Candidatus Woesearchaeota archaeon]|nr:FkbM family methyltransferase [Candidatus Woesearchaeota archaeon]
MFNVLKKMHELGAMFNPFLYKFGFRISRLNRSLEYDNMIIAIHQLKEKGFRPKTIIDIGAGRGRWTKAVLPIFPRTKYLCIDPLDENKSRLSKIAQQYGNIICAQTLLGQRKKTVIFYQHGNQSSIFYDSIHKGTPTKMTLTTLDNIIKQKGITNPDFIKLDVQGYELEVLKGATKTLSKAQFVLLEVSYSPWMKGMPIFHDVVAFMKQQNYRIYHIVSMSVRVRDSMPIASDVLFVKNGTLFANDSSWE